MKPIEEYILSQSESFREILYYVISVIEQEVPEVDLLFKWGIPYFYYKKKPFCYLAPNKKRDFVDIGFARGFQLTFYQDVLTDENRNTVKSLRYYKVSTIKDCILSHPLKTQFLSF